MAKEPEREVAPIEGRLLDEAYTTWFSAESECEAALRVWSAERSRGSAEAYWTYRAALDREEAAARDLQKLHQFARSWREGLSPQDNRVAVHDSSEPPPCR